MMNDEMKMHSLECKCFSWKPILIGALAAIGFSFLLNLFSIAIGLTAFTTNSQGVETLAFGGLIATALGLVVSMFAAGWLAGYTGSRYCVKRHMGALYGFLTWCLALIIMIFLADHIQHYVMGYTHFISGTGMTYVAASNSAAGMQASTNASTTSLVISTYIVFVLFFLSAFACSFGGHAGMRYVYKCECK